MFMMVNHRLISLVCVIASISSNIYMALAFHDCIEASARMREKRRQALLPLQFHHHHHHHHNVDNNNNNNNKNNNESCAGGICIGMKNGPHEGGNASYPISWDSNIGVGTIVQSTMTVPDYPKQLDHSVTYYLWTDIYFGDASNGRMNQFVPQLLLGDVLDGSSGYPNYKPEFHFHTTYKFGAHYFFEIWNNSTQQIEAHAAYGDLFPTIPGETLYTKFELKTTNKNNNNKKKIGYNNENEEDVRWILTMGVVGDNTRVSTLVVEQPYMGMGANWNEQTTTSWLEPSYKNMCINACWEIYGGKDSMHLPSSGAQYNLEIIQPPHPSSSNKYYNFTSWEEDEGNGKCPSCQVRESHTDQIQTVQIAIEVMEPPDATTDMATQQY